jgi:hypothetical protein
MIFVINHDKVWLSMVNRAISGQPWSIVFNMINEDEGLIRQVLSKSYSA